MNPQKTQIMWHEWDKIIGFSKNIAILDAPIYLL